MGKNTKYYTYLTTDGHAVVDKETPELGTLVCTGTEAECIAATGAQYSAPDPVPATPDSTEE